MNQPIKLFGFAYLAITFTVVTPVLVKIVKTMLSLFLFYLKVFDQIKLFISGYDEEKQNRKKITPTNDIKK